MSINDPRDMSKKELDDYLKEAKEWAAKAGDKEAEKIIDRTENLKKWKK